MAALFGGLILVAALMAGVWLGVRRQRDRRAQVRRRPFPPAWRDLLETDVALYRVLPEALKDPLHAHILEFLAYKRFEGCGGLALPEEAPLVVAALACMLVLQRPSPVYPGLCSVLLYPKGFRAPRPMLEEDGYFEEEDSEDELDGESWDTGAVVLSWHTVRKQAHRANSPENVVLHEFAHQLAYQEGFADGTGLLTEDSGPRGVFLREYERLQRRAERGRSGVIDEYGASDPAEFFAVISEAFFGQPRRLQLRHGELYEALRQFYGLDPLAWEDAKRAAQT